MRVRNPDPAVNSLSGNIRIRLILKYSDLPEIPDSGIRIKQVKGEEKNALVCRRPQSIDRGQLMSAGEREGGGVCPGVC